MIEYLKISRLANVFKLGYEDAKTLYCFHYINIELELFEVEYTDAFNQIVGTLK